MWWLSGACLSQNRAVTTQAETERELPGTAPAFRRVVLKLSGEALMGEHEYGIDPTTRRSRSRARSCRCRPKGLELAIVVGGGNIYRGMAAAAEGMDRATADYAGMLATVLNALALQDALERARRRHARALRARGLGGRGALHPASRDAAPREGADRDLRGRHGKPVLHDRHRRRPAGARDRRRGDPDGQERYEGCLRRRPAHGPRRDVPARPDPPRGDRARASA